MLKQSKEFKRKLAGCKNAFSVTRFIAKWNAKEKIHSTSFRDSYIFKALRSISMHKSFYRFLSWKEKSSAESKKYPSKFISFELSIEFALGSPVYVLKQICLLFIFISVNLRTKTSELIKASSENYVTFLFLQAVERKKNAKLFHFNKFFFNWLHNFRLSKFTCVSHVNFADSGITQRNFSASVNLRCCAKYIKLVCFD